MAGSRGGSVQETFPDQLLPDARPVRYGAFHTVHEPDRAAEAAVVDVEVGVDFRRGCPALLRGVLVDGVERDSPLAEPPDRVVEQLAVAHRVKYQAATVVRKFFQYGNRPGVVADFGICVCHDRSVEIDGDQCIAYSHLFLVPNSTSDFAEEKFQALNIPVEFIKIHHEADGTFPNGIPNPILVENRASTRNAVLEHKADMGIAWDGDFDRCFLFDEKGQFIEGYYIVGLLAQAFLLQQSGEKIVHDPRLVWNTFDIAGKYQGIPVQSKSGHAFIKDVMREHNAVYGGEMSAHHYFRDFAYCDSGMIPWLLVAELLCVKGQTLQQQVGDRMAAYPASGETNSKLADPQTAIARVLAAYQNDALIFDETDGISLEFADWRFNLRSSNTEPVVRLNVESRADAALMTHKTAEILALLRQS